MGALLTSGCALELNKLDKILTDGSWTIDSWNQLDKTVTNTDKSGPGSIDSKVTSSQTTTLSGTTQTEVTYDETAETPGTTVFTKYTYSTDVTLSATFNEDGTYTINTSKKYNTVVGEDETGSLGSFNFTDPASTSSITGYWNWVNTTDAKSQINISDLGTFNVTLEKGKGTFVKNTKFSSVDNSTSGGFPQTITTDETHDLTFTSSK
ncbi:MAG: hypothetical protein WCP57_10035 [Bacteroidota bacterium]